MTCIFDIRLKVVIDIALPLAKIIEILAVCQACKELFPFPARQVPRALLIALFNKHSLEKIFSLNEIGKFGLRDEIAIANIVRGTALIIFGLVLQTAAYVAEYYLEHIAGE